MAGLGVLALLLAIFATPALAQDANPGAEIRVAAMVAPPFVLEEKGALTGFAVELWNAIADQMQAKSSYQIVPNAPAVEEALANHQVDVAVSPLVITLNRLKSLDCSLPILEVGLQIMVRRSGQTLAQHPLLRELSLLFSATAFTWLGIALLLVLIPAHIVWLLERFEDEGIVSDARYFPGIFQAMYWALACLATQAEKMPHHWLARLIAIFWMFTGVAFVASYTARLTSQLTVQQIRNPIEGPNDLPGKEVGAITNTYAAAYLEAHHAHLHAFSTPEEMYRSLRAGEVDAVVGESPLLRYFALHQGSRHVVLIGPQFDTGLVTILMQLNSPWRRKVDIALLSLRENGTYARLHKKWFGEP
ncbi:MAG TPA: transporter substrate-binding domain-containing protein [Candidatus Binataceae bacterium]|nr:transporter substrate-binding domain-containing protein [Candidatus Binataceae bacterium]